MTDEHEEQVERPEDSRYYDVRHDQYEQVPEEERKSGPPSPMLEEDR